MLSDISYTIPSQILTGYSDNITLFFSLAQILTITILPISQQDKSVLTISPRLVTLLPQNNDSILSYDAIGAGSAIYLLNSSVSNITIYPSKYLRFSVIHSYALDIISQIIGWLYFIAWSVSFYPQIFLNIKRRSVVGLNFDFLAYNLTGFLCYSAFNTALFWSSEIQQIYFSAHPGGINPVKINDVIFSLHAVLATIITIIQCLLFKRDGQKISYAGYIILTIMYFLIILFSLIGTFQLITWLTYLYVLSYIKLAITLIKYIPQAWMNFRRKSTIGWSIGNVLLDLTGGSFSILQMFIISYNSDDWGSIFGDPTKFGLGLFSILFDIFFITQHYVLYRVPGKTCGFRKYETQTDDMSPLLKSESGSYGSNATKSINLT